ncbi:nucleotidyltransferase domain-containing protein [Candidatus Parcubacteria bacterium]|nr:MAG: nucleotidyltransferase domain-containing protein [Candidatus Parcubacteria bacterium]
MNRNNLIYRSFAKLITDLILKRLKKEVIAVGIFGSLAHGSYSMYSDLDIIVVTRRVAFRNIFFVLKSEQKETKNQLSFKDLRVGIFFKSKKEIYDYIKNPIKLGWMTEVSIFLNVVAVYDPTHFFNSCRKKYLILKRNVRKNFYVLAKKWLFIVYEFLEKLNNPLNTKSQRIIYGKEFCFAVSSIVKAFEGGFYINSYNFLEEIKSSRYISRVLYKNITKLFYSTDYKFVRKASFVIWDEIFMLAKKLGINIDRVNPSRLTTELIFKNQ